MMHRAGTKVMQLRVGGLDDNFSYLVLDGQGGAAIVDPCGDVSKIRDAYEKAGNPNPVYILITHGHNDHVSGVADVKGFFPAPIIGHPECPFKCSRRIFDHERLPFGDTFIECIFTPGHTQDGVCYMIGDGSAVFTGDTLFIDCCGYCEAQTMFKTMRERLATLPETAIVYSGHDYGHAPFESLGRQKRNNPYLSARSIEAFKEELKKL